VGDFGGIDENGGDVVGTQIHGGINGSQYIAGITNIFISYMIKNVNGTQRRLASIVVGAIPRASSTISETIQVLLVIDDLMVYNTYGIPSSVVGKIVQTTFIDK
jgi:hypothetical protein